MLHDESNEEAFRARLLIARMTAYSRQMPLLYMSLGSGGALLALSHWNVAPRGLVLAMPAVFICFCALRISMWCLLRGREIDVRSARRLEITANVVAPTLAAAFLLWTIALFGYGTIETRAHVILFFGFALVTTIFCQIHVRTAALSVAVVISPAFTVFLLTRGDPVLAAIGLNGAIICAIMIQMLLLHSRSFSDMVALQVETERLGRETRRLADVDSLTGLPTRRRFFECVQAEHDETRGRPRCVIAVIDLDGFKPVNDLHGHATGDRVLAEVGRRLLSRSTDKIMFGRLGGDEFGVLIKEDVQPEEALALGRRLCEALSAPYIVRGVLVKISASIGFASSADGVASSEKLYERADYALYHAKQLGRGRPVLFSVEHESAIRRLGVVEQALRSADLASEITLLFQPIVDVVAGRTIAFEALARWRSPTLGLVSPADFIPVAERSELINRLTRILLKKALEVAKSWPEDIRVSFNLSARDLSPDALLGLVALVRANGVAPGRIVFEITETAAMQDFEGARSALATLRALGSKISLDDFGAGYSSLNSVRRLTLDDIKIDRDFIVDVETDQTAQDIVKTVIDLCRNLKLNCVVEGVETEGQAAILRALGCRAMQGYLYARPFEAKDIAPYLAREAARAGLPEIRAAG